MQPVELHAKLGATIDRTLIDPLIVTKHGRYHLVMPYAERYLLLVATPKAGRTRKAAPPAAKLARTR